MDDDAERERDRGRISRGKCEHCCVISPLCRCVGIVCSPKSVLKSPPFISTPYTKHTYTHTLLHASPLSRCLSIFTFSGIQEDISWKKWNSADDSLVSSSLSFSRLSCQCLHIIFFSCVIYCVFLSCTALCCLFIDCECLWMNCTDWLDDWWFHFST